MKSADKAYGRLLAEILNNKLSPETRLVEAELAKRFAISRTPLREALFRLQREGFIGSVGRGFAVRPLTEREARESYPVVAALEAEGLAEGALLITSDVERLRIANRSFLVARKNPRAAIEADRAFHTVLFSRSSNRLLIRLIENLHRILIRYELLYMADTPLIVESAKQHDEIIEAVANGRIDLACAAVRRNYESGMHAVIGKLLS